MNEGVQTGAVLVQGVELDAQTRCAHYRSAVDVVAIRFFCCRQWFACLHCHDSLADHSIVPWPADAVDHAALCGSCGRLLRIEEYRQAAGCPRCAARFNPGCALHHDVYFR